jgi:hypothetical protein
LLTLEEFRSSRAVTVKHPHITKFSAAELRETIVGGKK